MRGKLVCMCIIVCCFAVLPIWEWSRISFTWHTFISFPRIYGLIPGIETGPNRFSWCVRPRLCAKYVLLCMCEFGQIQWRQVMLYPVAAASRGKTLRQRGHPFIWYGCAGSWKLGSVNAWFHLRWMLGIPPPPFIICNKDMLSNCRHSVQK